MRKDSSKNIKVESLIYDDKKMQKYLHEVGGRIYKERMKRGLSAAGLAELSNVSTSCICKLEAAQTEISLKVLLKIAMALDISVSSLLEDKKGESEKACITLEELQRLGELISRKDAGIIEAVLGIVDGVIEIMDKTEEKGIKIHDG